MQLPLNGLSDDRSPLKRHPNRGPASALNAAGVRFPRPCTVGPVWLSLVQGLASTPASLADDIALTTSGESDAISTEGGRGASR